MRRRWKPAEPVLRLIREDYFTIPFTVRVNAMKREIEAMKEMLQKHETNGGIQPGYAALDRAERMLRQEIEGPLYMGRCFTAESALRMLHENPEWSAYKAPGSGWRRYVPDYVKDFWN